VAVTVSLVPPLSAVGVGFSLLSRDVLSGSMLLFVINLLGIVLASMVVFSLFGFSRLQRHQDQKIKEELERLEQHLTEMEEILAAAEEAHAPEEAQAAIAVEAAAIERALEHEAEASETIEHIEHLVREYCFGC